MKSPQEEVRDVAKFLGVSLSDDEVESIVLFLQCVQDRIPEDTASVVDFYGEHKRLPKDIQEARDINPGDFTYIADDLVDVWTNPIEGRHTTSIPFGFTLDDSSLQRVRDKYINKE